MLRPLKKKCRNYCAYLNRIKKKTELKISIFFHFFDFISHRSVTISINFKCSARMPVQMGINANGVFCRIKFFFPMRMSQKTNSIWIWIWIRILQLHDVIHRRFNLISFVHSSFFFLSQLMSRGSVVWVAAATEQHGNVHKSLLYLYAQCRLTTRWQATQLMFTHIDTIASGCCV